MVCSAIIFLDYRLIRFRYTFAFLKSCRMSDVAATTKDDGPCRRVASVIFGADRSTSFVRHQHVPNVKSSIADDHGGD